MLCCYVSTRTFANTEGHCPKTAIWGWYADRATTRKTPFLFALLMLLAATTTIWLGRSLSLQVLGRAFQGAAASMLWITGLAMLADAVGSDNVVQYSGYVSIGVMFGSCVLFFCTPECLLPFPFLPVAALVP